jgi:hypothetical protein
MSIAALNPFLIVAAVTVGRSAAAVAGDSLAFAAELLQAAGGATPETSEEGPAAIERLRLQLAGHIGGLSKRIERQLVSASIVLSKPLELISDGLGGIVVAADHPQRAAIEEVLAKDVLLDRDFDRLADEYAQFVTAHGADDLAPTLTVVVPAAS